jgi:ketosteroid isomerase-like protein
VDEATIKGMFDSTVVWFKAGKFDSWAAGFSDNAYLQSPNGKTATGHAALVAWANSFPPIESLSFTNVQVSGDGNMAYGSSDYALKLKDAPADTGKQLVVAHRGSDAQWKVVAVSFNSDLLRHRHHRQRRRRKNSRARSRATVRPGSATYT